MKNTSQTPTCQTKRSKNKYYGQPESTNLEKFTFLIILIRKRYNLANILFCPHYIVQHPQWAPGEACRETRPALGPNTPWVLFPPPICSGSRSLRPTWRGSAAGGGLNSGKAGFLSAPKQAACRALHSRPAWIKPQRLMPILSPCLSPILERYCSCDIK